MVRGVKVGDIIKEKSTGVFHTVTGRVTKRGRVVLSTVAHSKVPYYCEDRCYWFERTTDAEVMAARLLGAFTHPDRSF